MVYLFCQNLSEYELDLIVYIIPLKVLTLTDVDDLIEKNTSTLKTYTQQIKLQPFESFPI